MNFTVIVTVVLILPLIDRFCLGGKGEPFSSEYAFYGTKLLSMNVIRKLGFRGHANC